MIRKTGLPGASFNERGSPMIETLRRLLGRTDLEHAGPITAQEARRWPAGALDRFVALKLLCKTTASNSIRYDGCDHDCEIELEIVTHAVTGEQFGVHACAYGECGLVRIPLDDFRQWKFDMLATAKTVAEAIDASGKVVEDVPDRLVAMGSVVIADVRRDVFLARGMDWDDAEVVMADARHLKASAAPLVLVLANLPEHPIWPDCKPALAVLEEMVSFDENGLVVDLSLVIGRPTKPHPDAMESEWLTVTAAAELLVSEDVIDDLDFKRAKARISRAATSGRFMTNGEQGAARRVESGSFSKWVLEQRSKNLEKFC